jgi:polar amino acid transport system permease protein
MSWDWDYAIRILPQLLTGVWMTLLVTAVSSVIALGGGLAIAIFESVTGRRGRWFSRSVIELFRGIPILVLLYFGFFALPEIGIRLSAFVIGTVVLGVVYGAFCSEVYRGALLTLPQGIRDACVALNLSPWVTWTRVLIPLMVKNSAAALVGFVLILFRQSAFLFALGVPVLLGQAQTVGYESFRYLEPFTLAGVFYLILNIPFVLVLKHFESRHA